LHKRDSLGRAWGDAPILLFKERTGLSFLGN
jgi:hypothetical protein